MQRVSQSPIDAGFVQDPYPFYAKARAAGDVIWWTDYNLPAATTHAAVHMLLRDKRFGRERPRDAQMAVPKHLTGFHAVEQHSMLDAEPPRHTRLRGQVLRAFTSRRIAGLAPEITAICDTLIDAFPDGPFDLIPAYCTHLPVIIIARLLGVPEADVDRLLSWSHAMVAMYQAGRTRAIEDAADRAARDFARYLRGHIDQKRQQPGDDLLSALLQTADAGDKLSEDDVIGTAILLLNAGHEATVHALGNAVHLLLGQDVPRDVLSPAQIPGTVEEALRLDPPLHLFTRFAYEDVTLFGHRFQRGDEVALLLASANRDETNWPNADRFLPSRPQKVHHSFGGGLHFCLGAPLARLELQIALTRLFDRCPNLALAGPAQFSDSYHFRGLTGLTVTA